MNADNEIYYKLEKKVFINGTIDAVTGISVGGSSIGLEIGGADKTVVRNPITNEPYIPGSSIKGKMRSLMEKLHNRISITVQGAGKEMNTHDIDEEELKVELKDKNFKDISAKPCKCGKCPVCKIFGVAAEDEGSPARLLVRDAELTEESRERLLRSKHTDMPFSEVKTEVVIDRITSAATPRNFERVPAGTKFNLKLVCNLYEGDNADEILKNVFQGLRLLQDDYLGGSGTRGYGQVKFNVSELKYKDKDCYEKDESAKDYNGAESVPDELKG